MAELNESLAARYAVKNLAVRLSYPTIILDQAAIAKSSLNRAEVEAAAARFVAGFPGIAAVYTRGQLEAGALLQTPLSTLVLRAWNRE